MATISMKLDRRRANARGLFPIQFLLSHKGYVEKTVKVTPKKRRKMTPKS
jgi:hypothetical protein